VISAAQQNPLFSHCDKMQSLLLLFGFFCNYAHASPEVVLITSLQTIPEPTVFAAAKGNVMTNRVFENLMSIGENCFSAKKVVVLVDRFLPVALATPRLLDAINRAHELFPERAELMKSSRSSSNQSSSISNAEIFSSCITARVVGHQPTYAEILEFASSRPFHGELVAVANADIVLRNTDRLNRAAFASEKPSGVLSDKPLALALSVSVHPGLTCAKKTSPKSAEPNMCASYAQGFSWDAHIFMSPLTVDFNLLEYLLPIPVFPNALGAENRVGFMLTAAGYEVRNPCLDIVAEHWHCSSKSHGRSGRVDASVSVIGVDPPSSIPNSTAWVDAGLWQTVSSKVSTAILSRPKSTNWVWITRCEGGRGVLEKTL
jgi:hypothetical protein